MRTILLTAAVAATLLGSTSEPAQAEPICVRVAVGVAHINPALTPTPVCPYDPGPPTRAREERVNLGPAYVEVEVHHP